MDSLPRGLGGGGLGLLSDVCLLCGFSVARRSAKGAADGRVCYLCASATGQDGDVWRLPLVLRKAGVAEADVVRATERAVARANAAFDEDADELVLRAAGGGGGGGGGGGQTSLPRTLCSLREARLNSRVLRAFFQPSSGKEGAMARERAVLPFNPAKNGVVVTAERVSASDVECYVRLGRVRALEAWPAPDMADLDGADSCSLDGTYVVYFPDQVACCIRDESARKGGGGGGYVLYAGIIALLLVIVASFFLPA